MLIRIGYDIEFETPAPTPMVTLLNVHPSRFTSLRQPESLRVEPHTPIQFFTDPFGNTGGRLLLPAGPVRFLNDAVVADTGEPDHWDLSAVQHPINELPPAVLPFLMASRYCEVDMMQNTAWELFKDVPQGFPLAFAIRDWVHNRITFGYPDASPTRTAMGGYTDCKGVCRDFQHLAITLSRCMNIPARYATGYLGDIGIPAMPCPMDFSAWYEIFLGGRWWTMDARHNVPRIGRVLMAVGRDAVDCALTTAFGVATLKKFLVWTDEVKS